MTYVYPTEMQVRANTAASATNYSGMDNFEVTCSVGAVQFVSYV